MLNSFQHLLEIMFTIEQILKHPDNYRDRMTKQTPVRF